MKPHAEGSANSIKHIHKSSQASKDYLEFRLESATLPEAKALARTGKSTPFELFARQSKKRRSNSAS